MTRPTADFHGFYFAFKLMSVGLLGLSAPDLDILLGDKGELDLESLALKLDLIDDSSDC